MYTGMQPCSQLHCFSLFWKERATIRPIKSVTWNQPQKRNQPSVALQRQLEVEIHLHGCEPVRLENLVLKQILVANL